MEAASYFSNGRSSGLEKKSALNNSETRNRSCTIIWNWKAVWRFDCNVQSYESTKEVITDLRNSIRGLQEDMQELKEDIKTLIEKIKMLTCTSEEIPEDS